MLYHFISDDAIAEIPHKLVLLVYQPTIHVVITRLIRFKVLNCDTTVKPNVP